MNIEVVKLPVTNIEIFRAGPKGDSAYVVWQQNGHPDGTLQEFFAANTKTFQYINTMDATFTHNFGRAVSVQVYETLTGEECEVQIERLDLDRVRIQTLINKTLTIVIN
jgi:hypothetical protein